MRKKALLALSILDSTVRCIGVNDSIVTGTTNKMQEFFTETDKDS
jgi:hypothetical protein